MRPVLDGGQLGRRLSTVSQAMVMEVKAELGTQPYESALGQCQQRLEWMFAAQPGRTLGIAMAIGRSSVEVIAATKDPHSQDLSYQHLGAQPLSLRDPTSLGLRALLAVACVSAETAGFIQPLLPQVELEYGVMDLASLVPLKLSSAADAEPRSPRATRVFKVSVRRGPNLEPCILKVAKKEVIDQEVSIASEMR